jgi:hypothetical protein
VAASARALLAKAEADRQRQSILDTAALDADPESCHDQNEVSYASPVRAM